MQATKRTEHLCDSCEKRDCPARTGDDIPVRACRTYKARTSPVPMRRNLGESDDELRRRILDTLAADEVERLREDNELLRAVVEAAEALCIERDWDMRKLPPGSTEYCLVLAIDDYRQWEPQPRPDSGEAAVLPRVRNEVMALAVEMERKLAKHDGDRGSDGWLQDHWRELHDRLLEESTELATAAYLAEHHNREVSNVLSEAADVANFAMMIAMVCGAMENVQ